MAIKPVKVSQLNGYIKRILQSDPLLGNVSVVGEISNLKYHGTGHIYFTLRDENSKISCFLAAENRKHLRYELTDGIEIVANGYIYLYERGGSYSLNVREIALEGVGNLSVAFEKLKQKLAGEGLFDEKYKKSIPFFPRKIAVITSETGAAVRDILKIIQSKNQIVDVLVYPCLVQGPGAAGEIAQAVREVNRLFPEIDTIILGRGGGSMEELWAFNEEEVARSIFASVIPVISAVGHETDFTIADFVADKRAETPTAAAHMAVPDIEGLKEFLAQQKSQLKHLMERIIRYGEQQILRYDHGYISDLLKRKIDQNNYEINILKDTLQSSFWKKWEKYDHLLQSSHSELEALNPANIMKRGYAAVLDGQGYFKNSVTDFSTGDPIITVFTDGSLDCTVSAVRRNENGKNERE